MSGEASWNLHFICMRACHSEMKSAQEPRRSLSGLSVCKLSENFNENSEIIFLILLLGVLQDYGKQFQTLPTVTKIKGQQIGNLSWQTNIH